MQKLITFPYTSNKQVEFAIKSREPFKLGPPPIDLYLNIYLPSKMYKMYMRKLSSYE